MFKKTHKKRNNLRYLFWRKLFKQLPPNRRLMRQGFKLMKCLQLPISCSAPSCRWRRRDCAADLWNSQHLQGLVQVSFENRGQRPPLPQYKVLKLEFSTREERNWRLYIRAQGRATAIKKYYQFCQDLHLLQRKAIQDC